MPRRRPPGGAAGLSSSLIAFLLFFPLIAAAQQQQPPQNGYQRSPRQRPHADTIGRDHKSDLQHLLETTQRTGQSTSLISKNERALATYAPAEPNPAVRAPASRYAPGTTAGVSSRLSARSLHDWEVVDFVLLATVDGKIYARDRNTGEHRWALEADVPMVETIHHKQNRSHDDDVLSDIDFLWIVEPSQDGSLYIYAPDGGIQKTGLTVKQLAEIAPYSSEDPPVVYTAERRNTLYTVDASTGNILKTFSSTGSTVVDAGSCRRVQGLEGPDDEECEPAGVLTLGKTEYTVGIQDSQTGNPVCTIKYFEWSPNNRDRDLHDQYQSTMDNKYIYSRFDGKIFALDHNSQKNVHPQKPLYHHKFDSPVVRVFDVARPYQADPRDTSLVILPQPIGPASDYETHDIFVNCTEGGSWYAMSEDTYPTVTDGASKANCYSDEWRSEAAKWRSWQSPKRIVGVHSLKDSHHQRSEGPPLRIGAPPPANVASPGETVPTNREKESSPIYITEQTTHSRSAWSSYLPWFLVVLLFCSFGGATYKGWVKPPAPPAPTMEKPILETPLSAGEVPPVMPAESPAVAEELPNNRPERPKVRFDVPDDEGRDTAPRTVSVNGDESPVDSKQDGVTPTVDDVNAAQETPKKKKAHRGQRGGRRRKKSTAKSENGDAEDDEVTRIVKGVTKFGDQSLQPDEVTVNGDEGVTDVSGTIQIHNLTINTDRILGNGSGGTFVFEGQFEGRNVAVKRMLPQYFELASQEVNLLQQSDDHPNVIRYFCQQKDQNFLYIAVELCQASLWDLYHDGRREEALTDQQSLLVTAINSDVTRALYQLAAGVNHLHSLRIIHRDIKPQNILIAYPKKNQTGGPRFVISDFGLCKTLPDNASTLVGTTGNAGTVGWKAPELISVPRDVEGRSSSTGHSRESSSSNDPVSQGVKRAVDIFSLGCVFFYVLTNGSHPFDDDEGWMQLRERNIKKNHSNFSKLNYLGDDSVEPVDLISKMLSQSPEDRPTAHEIMHHPFFWSPEKRLNFLCDVSDHWEREQRDPPSPHLAHLELYNEHVIGNRPRCDFLSKLDRKFIDTLGKQRKYTGDRMLDLLRALRNKKNHYEDMPPDVKARVGPLPGGYLRYWTVRFPNLLMACYDVVRELGLDREPRFRTYFEAPSALGATI